MSRRIHKRHVGAGNADWDAIAARSQRVNARNVAAVRAATRSTMQPEHGLAHKGQERAKADEGVGKALHGDKRTAKSAANYKPGRYTQTVRSLNIPADSFRNIINGF